MRNEKGKVADRGHRPTMLKAGKSSLGRVSASVEGLCLDIDNWSTPPAKTLLLIVLYTGVGRKEVVA